MSEESERRSHDSRRRAGLRILAVVIATLTVVYVVRLVGLGVDARRASQAEMSLATDVAELEREVEALETGAAEAGSDDAVEHWAREELNWARPGDRPVAPVPAASTTPGSDEKTDGEEDEGAWHRLRRWIERNDNG